jgi:hypothetical protein
MAERAGFEPAVPIHLLFRSSWPRSGWVFARDLPSTEQRRLFALSSANIRPMAIMSAGRDG